MSTNLSNTLYRSTTSTANQIKLPYGKNMIGLVLMSTLLISPLPAIGQSSIKSVTHRTYLISQKEKQYDVNSFSPEEKQVYEIIQRAKRGLRQQPGANFLGALFGITPQETTQTPQDLDLEFQNAIRNNNSTNSQPPLHQNVAPDAKLGNPILQRILNKRSNETHEQWYARIDPIIQYTPGEEYRAWKATLSPNDKVAYDALVRKENVEKRERMQEAEEAVGNEIRRELSCRWILDSNGDYVKICND